MRRQCCLPMTENPEASVLTAKRAPQHIRLSRANDAYEHLCILTLLPSLAPLHLMLADTPWPHGFGATLTNVGPLSEGFERSVASPLQPRRLCAMGRTVRSISSLSDNHSNSFQVAIRVARRLDSNAGVLVRSSNECIGDFESPRKRSVVQMSESRPGHFASTRRLPN